LWDNQDTFWLEGNDRCCKGKTTTFAHDLFTQRALNFIDKNKDTSFFLYVPYTLPHGGFIIPEEEYAQFDDKDWSDQQKVYAGMIERIDKDMGLLFDALKEYGIDSNTLVFFCSDNGAANRYEGLFNSSGALKGRKRDMYEGGIRVPMIVRMPGLVPAGEVSDHPWYFPDVMPTLAEITGASLPDNIDGISIAPLLKGENLPSGNRFMYWEFHEGQFAQAARWKNWKAVRYEMSDTLELYNLSKDLAEDNNIAKDHPEITKKMIEYLNTERTESKYWKP
ncbi:MAG: sulfatase-like hydrolase/transferase, partial [Bacteroidota bacterium]